MVAWSSAGSAGADDAADLARLRAEIDTIVRDSRHCHNVVQCRVVSMGFDACGNPTHHVAYNDLRGAGAALASKASEYTFIEEEAQRGRARPAQCPPPARPQPACYRNRCAAGAVND